MDAVLGDKPAGEAPPVIVERPSWLPEKFKTGEDLVKSYSELEKKIGSVPEEYDLSKSMFLDADREPIKDFLATAREKRVPKEVMDKLVDSMDRYLGEFDIDMSQEAAKLGENAKERLTTLDNWAKANLSDGSYRALINNLQSADAIHALEELRGKMMSGNTMVPSGNEASMTNVETLEQVKQEIVDNIGKYKTDEKYRKSIEARLTIVAKNSGILDKSSS